MLHNQSNQSQDTDTIFVSSHMCITSLNGMHHFDLIRQLTKTQTTCVAIERRSAKTAGTAEVYLYVDPFEVLKIHSGTISSERGEHVISREGRPLDHLQQFLNRYELENKNRIPAEIHRPFVRAAIGFLGYDCVQYLENIALQPTDSKSPEACFAVFRVVYIFNESENSVTIAVNCFSDGERQNAEEKLQLVLDGFHTRTISSSQKSESSSPTIRKQFQPEEFGESVKQVKEHIRRGDVFQCVLSQRVEFQSLSEPLEVFENLRQQNPSPYHFYFKSSGQTLIGASPEPLIKVEGQTIQTFPIAGTRPRGVTAETDRKQVKNLRGSRKENAEHLMLVDLSRNDLGKICKAGTVKVSEYMRVQKLSHVMHLVSEVEGQLPNKRSAFAALLACFPAGTLTGAPKVRAMQIIATLEKDRRGLYGGALVMLDFNGDLDSCILIRSLVDNGERSYIQAGAGIVADSKADREFQEIVQKSAAMRRAIGGAL